MSRVCLLLIHLLLLVPPISCRRHVLKLKNDFRAAVLCSRFGYFNGGQFAVSMGQVDGHLDNAFFTLDKVGGGDIASYLVRFIESIHDNTFNSGFKTRLLLIHNNDEKLQKLIFESGAQEMDDGEHVLIPATLEERIQIALESLRLVPKGSMDVSRKLTKLLDSTPGFTMKEIPIKQYSVLSLLYKLAQIKVGDDSIVRKDLSKRQASAPPVEEKTIANEKDESDRSDPVIIALRGIYQNVAQSGSLRALPYELNQGKLKVKFTVYFVNKSVEGLYSFYFHNCPIGSKPLPTNLTLSIVEKNTDSYLSGGEQPLPMFYFVMCCVYLIASLVWFVYLRISKNPKYRIHYLMFTVVLIKAISLGFHGINFYVIGKHGVHEEGWAVMYYITHIFRGALLFITILLIGAGWAFVKHMLTPRERNVFLIVIPLQILANVATVVIEESDAGTARYALWKDIFIFVDLACCGAILFPVVWSIRHLQAGSQTDGKAAMNLRNLRLFRHFYMLVICYVYFTRVIAYLLTITVSYSFVWVVELFKETVTCIFFVAVGYKFRPIDNNPYLLVANDEDEDEETVMERIQLEDVWAQSGFSDGLTKLNRSSAQQPTRATGVRNPAFAEQTTTDELPDSDRPESHV